MKRAAWRWRLHQRASLAPTARRHAAFGTVGDDGFPAIASGRRKSPAAASTVTVAPWVKPRPEAPGDLAERRAFGHRGVNSRSWPWRGERLSEPRKNRLRRKAFMSQLGGIARAVMEGAAGSQRP